MNSIRNNNYFSTPSFGAYYKSSYGKRLEKALLFGDFTEDIVSDFETILQKRKNGHCKMGDGGWGEVFRIDDYFVFKTYYDLPPKIGPVRVNLKTRFDCLKTYCGKVLARIGNIEIIRNAAKDKHNFLEMAKVVDDGSTAYQKSLSEFVSLPQRAFDNIAGDFKLLNELAEGNLHYRFDTNNANNFLKVGKAIKIVDDIDITPCPQPNDLYALLRVFIQEGGDMDKKKELFRKCIMASEKHQLPMEASFKYFKSFMDEIFANAGVKVSFEKFYQDVTALRQAYPDETVRLAKVKEYLATL